MVQYAEVYLDPYVGPSFKYHVGGPGAVLTSINTTLDSYLTGGCKLGTRPLTIPRAIGDLQVGNCRDFSLMLTSILRYQGIPARTRCGFGKYFLPGHFEDHSFNKIELLPWDMIPGCMTHNLEDPLAEGSELSFYDGIAALTLAGDMAFDELRAIYEKDARFHAT